MEEYELLFNEQLDDDLLQIVHSVQQKQLDHKRDRSERRKKKRTKKEIAAATFLAAEDDIVHSYKVEISSEASLAVPPPAFAVDGMQHRPNQELNSAGQRSASIASREKHKGHSHEDGEHGELEMQYHSYKSGGNASCLTPVITKHTSSASSRDSFSVTKSIQSGRTRSNESQKGVFQVIDNQPTRHRNNNTVPKARANIFFFCASQSSEETANRELEEDERLAKTLAIRSAGLKTALSRGTHEERRSSPQRFVTPWQNANHDDDSLFDNVDFDSEGVANVSMCSTSDVDTSVELNEMLYVDAPQQHLADSHPASVNNKDIDMTRTDSTISKSKEDVKNLLMNLYSFVSDDLSMKSDKEMAKRNITRPDGQSGTVSKIKEPCDEILSAKLQESRTLTATPASHVSPIASDAKLLIKSSMKQGRRGNPRERRSVSFGGVEHVNVPLTRQPSLEPNYDSSYQGEEENDEDYGEDYDSYYDDEVSDLGTIMSFNTLNVTDGCIAASLMKVADWLEGDDNDTASALGDASLVSQETDDYAGSYRMYESKRESSNHSHESFDSLNEELYPEKKSLLVDVAIRRDLDAPSLTSSQEQGKPAVKSASPQRERRRLLKILVEDDGSGVDDLDNHIIHPPILRRRPAKS